MSPLGRTRTSLVLLLVLAAGLLVAGAAAASGAHEMACCPAGMEASATGCTWLGAGDCCPERPTAQAPASAAPPAAPATTALVVSAPAGPMAPHAACAAQVRPLALRTLVLRL